MRIGILFEGKFDRDCLQILISRILTGCVEQLDFKEYPSEGSILDKIPAAMRSFFENNAVDLGVFVSDTDGESGRRRLIEDRISAQLKHNPQAEIVIGMPDQNFEQWFISEEVAIKSLYGLKSSDPLPFGEIRDPKKRLREIHDNSEIGMITRTKAYAALTQNLNLKLLEKDASYGRFAKELREKAGCPGTK